MRKRKSHQPQLRLNSLEDRITPDSYHWVPRLMPAGETANWSDLASWKVQDPTNPAVYDNATRKPDERDDITFAAYQPAGTPITSEQNPFVSVVDEPFKVKSFTVDSGIGSNEPKPRFRVVLNKALEVSGDLQLQTEVSANRFVVTGPGT